MIFKELFWGFFKVSCFTFGGGFGAIALIRDLVLGKGWLDEEMLTYMIAVGESTPGPIMVNLATYVGCAEAGFLGALVATLAVVLPSFIIILLITALLKNAFKNKYVQAVLRGLKPSVIGIVLAMGVYMLVKNCLMEDTFKMNLRSIVITAVLGIVAVLYKYFSKKKMSPIIMIVISSLLGMFVYAI